MLYLTYSTWSPIFQTIVTLAFQISIFFRITESRSILMDKMRGKYFGIYTYVYVSTYIHMCADNCECMYENSCSSLPCSTPLIIMQHILWEIVSTAVTTWLVLFVGVNRYFLNANFCFAYHILAYQWIFGCTQMALDHLLYTVQLG